MSELKPIRIGTRVTEYPALTHNALIEGEVKRRGTLLAIDDTRKPKQKLPVVARLIWSGEDAVAPGSALKLGDAVFDPGSDDSAPFRALAFFVDEFVGGDLTQPYAITMGPIDAGDGTPAVGYGIIPEAWWAQVSISDALHTHATQAVGTVLASSNDGYRILWKESGTGTKWAIVQLVKDAGSSSEPPLRRFELTADKATTDATATGKFLDDAGSMVGSDETFYDPMGKFYGKTAAFFGGGQGFRGIALLRRDEGGIEADRWEIVNMEGFADWVVMEYAGSPDNEWQLSSFGNTDPWNFLAPADPGDPLTIADPLSTLGTPQDGDKIIAVLTNPDTSPPTYQEREVKKAGYGSVTIKNITGVDVVVESGALKVKLQYAEYSVMAKDLSSTGTLTGTLTLTDVVINNPTSIELNDNTTDLESKLNYTPKTLHLLTGSSDSSSTNFSDNVTIDEC